jgi:hypothetical protein
LAIDWYSLIRFVHVVSAIFLVGPHFVLALMIRYMRRNPESSPTVLPVLEKAGRYPGIGGPLMVITGLLMVALGNGGWSALGELWVAGSLILFLFTAIWVNVGIAPAFKAMTETIKGGPIKPDELKVLCGRVIARINVESVALVVVVILMILKPTL